MYQILKWLKKKQQAKVLMTRKAVNTLLLILTIMLSFVYGTSLVNALCTHGFPHRISVLVSSVLSLIINFWLIVYICRFYQR